MSWRIFRLLEFGVIEIDMSEIFDGERFSIPKVKFCMTPIIRYVGEDNLTIDVELAGPTIRSTVLDATT